MMPMMGEMWGFRTDCGCGAVCGEVTRRAQNSAGGFWLPPKLAMYIHATVMAIVLNTELYKFNYCGGGATKLLTKYFRVTTWM
jgi:hypothetical protein